MRQVVDTMSDKETKSMAFYASHAIGGMVGGGITAALFQQRPIPGMFLCTPLMLGIALAEQAFETAKEARLQEMLAMSKGSSDENETGYP
jgi:tartrate dehydratase alpha subunit/fumarate hydratase class I-like protein